jgi:hypothetical protein
MIKVMLPGRFAFLGVLKTLKSINHKVHKVVLPPFPPKGGLIR